VTREKYGLVALRYALSVPVLTSYVICALLRPVFEPIAQPSHAEASVLGKVLGNLRAIFMQLVRDVA
jgi:hypothetical protein